MRAHKRTSKEVEENVLSVLYGNATQSNRVCISPVQVEEKKVEEPGEKTEDKNKNV